MNSTNKYRPPLTREDISQYVSSADQRVKHSIERKSQQSDFESVALEGWAGSTVPISSMRRIDKRFSSSKGFLITGITATMFILGGIVLWFMYTANNAIKPTHNEKHAITLTVEKTDVILPERIDSMKIVAPEEVIPATKIKQEFKEKTANAEIIDQSTRSVKSELNIEQLPLLKVDIPKTERSIKRLTAKEIYLFDFKLVDYRSYRSKPEIRTESLELTGVPANLEDEYALSEDAEWSEISIPYIDYIKKTTSILAKENYKQALSRYLKILESYPDDVNALFYSGLCYFNLNEHASAIEQFHQCLRSTFDNFYEESEWLLAKSYAADGQEKKATAVYELIVSKKGYYAAQAKKMLGH